MVNRLTYYLIKGFMFASIFFAFAVIASVLYRYISDGSFFTGYFFTGIGYIVGAYICYWAARGFKAENPF